MQLVFKRDCLNFNDKIRTIEVVGVIKTHGHYEKYVTKNGKSGNIYIYIYLKYTHIIIIIHILLYIFIFLFIVFT